MWRSASQALELSEVLKPRPRACRMMSTASGRSSASPPEKLARARPTLASSSMARQNSAVLNSSPAASGMLQ
jgi:hypothetical protein